ncbi:hypothetical protein Dimus_003648, partial [Dionaea muscipula]
RLGLDRDPDNELDRDPDEVLANLDVSQSVEEVIPETQNPLTKGNQIDTEDQGQGDQQRYEPTQQEAKRMRGESRTQNQKFKGQWSQLFVDNHKP